MKSLPAHRSSAPCSPPHRRAGWRGVLAACMLGLAACGGGGGSTGQPDAGGGTPPPPATAPAGSLWHTNYALDFLDGTQIAYADGRLPAYATTDESPSPWPDGQAFVTTDYDNANVRTRIRIVERATGTATVDVTLDGYWREARPSPASRSRVSFAYSPEFVSDDDAWVIVDFQSATPLLVVPTTSAFSWLPDGRYLLMDDDGTLRAGTPGTPGETVLARVAMPPGRDLGPIWVNRQGDRLAMRLHTPSVTGDHDLWVVGLDGRNLHQLTDTKLSHLARWSPDGRHIAFDVDTGYFCNGFGCLGTCEVWYVEADAVRVTALEAAGDAHAFRVKDRGGSVQRLGCELLAWTD